jgi:cysteinyl-tRNA synthetase
MFVYNTLSRQKERFHPLSPPDDQGRPQVKMYVCGVTVYDYCHLGHARTYTVWDVVRRYLQWRGYQVTFVQNFTDVDDKILRRAQENGESMQVLAERYIQAYFADMDRLNILRADVYPQVTHSLTAMIDLIQSLELKGFAYQVRGDVYYSVRKFEAYGQLSRRKLSDLQAGASGRVGEEDALKQDPFDFALWKSAPESEPGFKSPWGWGRPGWHLECSAMVRENLGDHIDIHAGGADLIFPHHENELAQSEPITGAPLARYWLHNGFLNINGEKMSKSLGNFTTLRQALEVWSPMALRLFFLQTHYRSPIDLTDMALEAATQGWTTLQKGIQAAQYFIDPSKAILGSEDAVTERLTPFTTAMDDDFSTPVALAVMFDLAKELTREHNIARHQGSPNLPKDLLHKKGQDLLTMMAILGFRLDPLDAKETGSLSAQTLPDIDIEALIQERQAAKKARQFAEADRIRDQLKAQGIQLVDQPGGVTRWIRSS